MTNSKRPTPLEIIRNMREKNFREEIILEEVEKELTRLESSLPEGSEAILKKYPSLDGVEITKRGDFLRAMDEYAASLIKENRELKQCHDGLKADLERCKKIASEQITSLTQSNEAKDKEIEGRKLALIELSRTIDIIREQREYWKQIAEAAGKLVDRNGWGNDAEWLKYEQLKQSKPK